MSENDLEEAHYWWAINEICDLIRQYGYTKVLIDVDKTLQAEDMAVTLSIIVDDQKAD